jgi:hypothetical protein
MSGAIKTNAEDTRRGRKHRMSGIFLTTWQIRKFPDLWADTLAARKLNAVL